MGNNKITMELNLFDIRVVIFSEKVEREARELLAALNSMYIQF